MSLANLHRKTIKIVTFQRYTSIRYGFYQILLIEKENNQFRFLFI